MDVRRSFNMKTSTMTSTLCFFFILSSFLQFSDAFVSNQVGRRSSKVGIEYFLFHLWEIVCQWQRLVPIKWTLVSYVLNLGASLLLQSNEIYFINNIFLLITNFSLTTGSVVHWFTGHHFRQWSTVNISVLFK